MRKMSAMFAFILAIAQGAQATIVSMQELYHPKLNQTIILAGDVHEDFAQQEGAQKSALKKIIKKSNAYPILEANDKAPTKSMLYSLYASCARKNQSVSAVDWRRKTLTLLGYALNAHANSDTIEKLFAECMQECVYAIQRIQEYNALQYTQERRIVREILDVELVGIKRIQSTMAHFIAQNYHREKSITHFVISDLQELQHNNSLIHKFISHIFELSMLVEILKNNNRPIMLVGVGAAHGVPLRSWLKDLGYTYKNTVDNLEDFLQASSMQDQISCAVDVNSFLTNCKTLQHHFSWSTWLKVGLVSGCVGACAYLLYRYFWAH